MNIRTILFDLDATCIHTNELIRVAFEHSLGAFDMHFTEAFLKAYQPTYYLNTMRDLLTVAGEHHAENSKV